MDATERQEWIEYAAAKNTDRASELRNVLVERYLGLAQSIARRYQQRVPMSIDYDELLSAAYVGLIDAVEKFELNRGYEPATYMVYRIRFAMADYLREVDDCSRLERIREKHVEQLARQLQHDPSPEEIQEYCGFSFRPLRVGSLSKDHDTGFDRTTTIGETIADEHRTGSVNDVAYLLAGLNKRERLVMLSYYLEGMSMRQIGKQLGLSESRVSQMHSQILTQVRANFERAA